MMSRVCLIPVILFLLVSTLARANEGDPLCALSGGVMKILTHDPKLLKEIVVTDCRDVMDDIRKWKARAVKGHSLGEQFAKFAGSDKVAKAALDEIKALYELCPDAEGTYTGQWFSDELKEGERSEFMCGKDGKIRTDKKAYDARMAAAATKLLKRFVERQKLKLVSLVVGFEEKDRGYYDDAPFTTARVEVKGVRYDLRISAFSAGGLFGVDEEDSLDSFMEIDSSLKRRKHLYPDWSTHALPSCVRSALKEKWKVSCPEREFPRYWIDDDDIHKDHAQVETEFVKTLGLDKPVTPVR